MNRARRGATGQPKMRRRPGELLRLAGSGPKGNLHMTAGLR